MRSQFFILIVFICGLVAMPEKAFTNDDPWSYNRNNTDYNDGAVGVGSDSQSGLPHAAGLKKNEKNEGATDTEMESTQEYISIGGNWELGIKVEAEGTNDLQIREGGSDTKLVIQEGTGNVGINTTNPGAKLEVIGDVKIGSLHATGQFTGEIGPNNGAPFPRPAYDSGFIGVRPNVLTTLKHGVGGDVDNYVVDIQTKGIFRGRGDPAPNGVKDTNYRDLTKDSISVELGPKEFPRAIKIRVRIWVY